MLAGEPYGTSAFLCSKSCSLVTMCFKWTMAWLLTLKMSFLLHLFLCYQWHSLSISRTFIVSLGTSRVSPRPKRGAWPAMLACGPSRGVACRIILLLLAPTSLPPASSLLSPGTGAASLLNHVIFVQSSIPTMPFFDTGSHPSTARYYMLHWAVFFCPPTVTYHNEN
jgi:hypothetical protein